MYTIYKIPEEIKFTNRTTLLWWWTSNLFSNSYWATDIENKRQRILLCTIFFK